MRKLFVNLGLAAGLAAMTLGMTSPAAAHDRRGGGDDAAIAIGAGLVGLAIGAAIASDDRRDRYYDGYYYHDRPRYRGGYGYYYSHPRYRYRDARRYRHYDRDRQYRRGNDRYNDRYDRRW